MLFVRYVISRFGWWKSTTQITMIKKPKNYSNLLNLKQNLASRIIQYLDALATNHPKSSQRISTNIHGKLCSHEQGAVNSYHKICTVHEINLSHWYIRYYKVWLINESLNECTMIFCKQVCLILYQGHAMDLDDFSMGENATILLFNNDLSLCHLPFFGRYFI